MNDQPTGQLPGPKNAGEYLAQLRTARAAALIASIPTTFGPKAIEAWSMWAIVVTQLAGKKTLARIVPPWTMYMNQEVRRPPQFSAGKWRRMLRRQAPTVARGRASNPTAR